MGDTSRLSEVLGELCSTVWKDNGGDQRVIGNFIASLDY